MRCEGRDPAMSAPLMSCPVMVDFRARGTVAGQRLPRGGIGRCCDAHKVGEGVQAERCAPAADIAARCRNLARGERGAVSLMC